MCDYFHVIPSCLQIFYFKKNEQIYFAHLQRDSGRRISTSCLFISAWHLTACGKEAGAEFSQGIRNQIGQFSQNDKAASAEDPTNNYLSSQQFPIMGVFVELFVCVCVRVCLIIESSDMLGDKNDFHPQTSKCHVLDENHKHCIQENDTSHVKSVRQRCQNAGRQNQELSQLNMEKLTSS